MTYITLFFILSLFIKFVLPQLIDSVVGLINDVPTYINNTSMYGYNLLRNLNIDEEYLNSIMKNFNGFVDFIIKFTTNLIPVLVRLLILKMPYILLISVIIGITNIIPFFWPSIGAVPAFIIILFVSPTQVLWFLVIILVIQQIDGNIIGSKILGNLIGISAFRILVSILIAGKVLGLLGMIIGVPLFAIIYSIIKDVIEV